MGALGESDRALHAIRQLAHVAGPTVCEKLFGSAALNSDDIALHASSNEPREPMVREVANPTATIDHRSGLPREELNPASRAQHRMSPVREVNTAHPRVIPSQKEPPPRAVRPSRPTIHGTALVHYKTRLRRIP